MTTTRARKSPSLLILSLLAFACALVSCARSEDEQAKQVRERLQSAPPALGSTAVMPTAEVARRAVPSVVNIAAIRVSRTPTPQVPLSEDPFFRHFFGPQSPQERRERSLGSGVIVSADGVILTNNHVVAETQNIRVTLSDGRELPAKIAGADPKSDLAVLRLQGKVENLQPIAFGSSAAMRLGDMVLAIGNPFGVGQTVTMGIISAVGRSRMGIVDYEDFIQTDAAINPGNSGGALVNMRGELVGINTAILSRSGGNQGIGFAIPTDMAKPIMKSLLADGKVRRGWLGVAIQDVTPALARGLRLSVSRGVLIAGVERGSPAAQAGIERGDVVLGIDGTQIHSSGAFRNRIAAFGPGKTIKLELLRRGKRTTLSARLGELAGRATAQADTSTEGLLSGLSFSDIDAEARSRYDIAKDVRGVVITGVAPGSRAADAGLQPGDVVLAVNRTGVGSVAELQKSYDPRQSSVVLLVQRKETSLYVVLRK